MGVKQEKLDKPSDGNTDQATVLENHHRMLEINGVLKPNCGVRMSQRLLADCISSTRFSRSPMSSRL